MYSLPPRLSNGLCSATESPKAVSDSSLRLEGKFETNLQVRSKPPHEITSPEEQPASLTPHDQVDFIAQAQVGQLDHSYRFTGIYKPPPEQASISAHVAIIDIDKHGFLCTQNLKCLPSEDINYLFIKGSLNIPNHHTTKELVENYFRKIHPMLPVLDEAQFWRAFGGDPTEKISLFVFQALIFAISPVRRAHLLRARKEAIISCRVCIVCEP